MISCGIDYWLQNVMLTKYNTNSTVQYSTNCTKNLLDVCLISKTSVDNTEWVCSTYTLKTERKSYLLLFVYEKAINDPI